MIGRSQIWKACGTALIAAGLIAIPEIDRPAHGIAATAIEDFPKESGLSVMTYNIEGLPWPVRSGRGAALAAIGTRLRELRDSGRQPHVVLLQEAFSEDAQRIGIDAGYPHIVRGPDAAMAGRTAVSHDDLDFEGAGRFLKGERSGKLVGSGLEILSDYPILEVRREAFPAYACAGYDCLANKGIVMAVVTVPGQPTPVAIVDVHLNSRHAAHVPRARSLYAYRAQIDALDDFLRRNAPAGMPMIVGGDFNIGQDGSRRAYVDARLGHWWGGAKRDAFHMCMAVADGCGMTMSTDALKSLRHGRDWQFLAPAGGTELSVRRIAVPFGREADGTMLSDHIGYAAYYSLGMPNPPLRLALAR
ncbi:MAG: Endonuclease/exonuclease/phosphatase [Rhizorhabdus sp.]|nr:Endonuclease/exonuclease/phosphatase [Rhizorhabdus sp.]